VLPTISVYSPGATLPVLTTATPIEVALPGVTYPNNDARTGARDALPRG
jgi:hypothetical protein